jgi:DNA-directed RNA polymerase subunit RPC12/RpoP
MTNDFKYYLHCSNCNLKRYTNGMDLDDLIEIKRTQPMRLVPKVDKYSGKLVVPPDVKRPKMYRCPRCGFTLRGHTIPAVPNLEGNNEQTNNPSGREAGPEGLPLP